MAMPGVTPKEILARYISSLEDRVRSLENQSRWLLRLAVGLISVIVFLATGKVLYSGFP